MIPINDWSLQRTTVLTPLHLPELTQEQSVELDYVLPDYYPDFFRLLHCTAEAAVTEQTVTDGTVQYALRVTLHVLYCGEQTETVQSVTQTLDYRGALPLPPEAADADRLQIRLTGEPSYLNCRAVSPRRIDLRGAVRIRGVLCGERRREVLQSAEGLHTQTRSTPVRFVSELMRTEKAFLLSDDIRLPDAQPPLLSVLRMQTALTVAETRVVAGKLVIKGEANVSLLYTASNGIEHLDATLPFSQIAELDALSDEMPAIVTAVLTEQTLTPEAEHDGDIRLLHCDLGIVLQCAVIRTSSAELLTDIYSTVHPSEPIRAEIPLLTAPMQISEHNQQKILLTKPDAVITKVYAAWAEPMQVQSAADASGGTVISGELQCCVLAADAEEHPMMLEERRPFTWELPQLSPAQALPPLRVQSCTYMLSGSDTVTLQPELLLSGTVMQAQKMPLLTDILIDPEATLPQRAQYALRLYFAQPNESVWEIAKRYHTAESAIREENQLAADTLTEPQMLLIPAVT